MRIDSVVFPCSAQPASNTEFLTTPLDQVPHPITLPARLGQRNLGIPSDGVHLGLATQAVAIAPELLASGEHTLRFWLTLSPRSSRRGRHRSLQALYPRSVL